MANKYTRRIVKGGLDAHIAWERQFLLKALDTGDVMADYTRPDDARTEDQNNKGWPMWRDISKQLMWYGNKLSPDDWKDLLSNEWQSQKVVPGISGGFCALGVRTSKMKKRCFSELIEITYAFGAQNMVVWSEESVKYYDQERSNKGA